MIYSAFKPILALHIVNFSSCQNYWGGGGKRYVCPPPPYKYIIFVGTFGGLAPPPQYQKAGYASGQDSIVWNKIQAYYYVSLFLIFFVSVYTSGGGGGTRLSTGRGVPLGGWKPDPVLNRSAHEKYTLS